MVGKGIPIKEDLKIPDQIIKQFHQQDRSQHSINCCSNRRCSNSFTRVVKPIVKQVIKRVQKALEQLPKLSQSEIRLNKFQRSGIPPPSKKKVVTRSVSIGTIKFTPWTCTSSHIHTLYRSKANSD